MLLSVGELSERKNHEVVIKALGQMKRDDIKYFIAGQGALEGYLNELIRQNGLCDNVKLLGFRCDVNKLTKAADAFIFPSLQEGLPVALMEAMATGLPVVCSNIRGNTDLIVDNYENRYLIDCKDINSWTNAIATIISSETSSIENNNFISVKKFDRQAVDNKMLEIYEQANTI